MVKCKGTIKSGKNKGKRCTNDVKKGNKKYCGLHSTSSKDKLIKKRVAYDVALLRFYKINKRSQQLDISKKSKLLHKYPNEYWMKNPTKHGDVEGLDEPGANTFGELDLFGQILNGMWVERINSGEKLSKDIKEELVDVFHQAKSTDCRKAIRRINDKEFILYLKKNARRTHPHITIECNKKLKQLKKKK